MLLIGVEDTVSQIVPYTLVLGKKHLKILHYNMVANQIDFQKYTRSTLIFVVFGASVLKADIDKGLKSDATKT